MIPIRQGSPEAFAFVRRFLLDQGFVEQAICERLSLPTISHYKVEMPQPDRREACSDALDALIRLFIRGILVDRDRTVALLGAEAIGRLGELGLLAEFDHDGPHFCGTVRLYPTHSLYIISDRWTNPDGSEFKMFDDIVYPADIRNTDEFMGLLPETPCDRLLDVCAGTGIFALYGAAHFARQAWAYDITGRSTAFAEFNARLNGLDNMGVGTGDCYEPAGDLTFDRITAHPPYVPVLEHTWTFHAGGEDGEHVTRKVIEGLPKHLAPGGRLYCVGLGSDRAEGPFELRVRQWLGPSAHEFDIVLMVKLALDPALFTLRQLMRGVGKQADLPRWKEMFARLKVTAMLHCALVIQRRATARDVFTSRRQRGPSSGGGELAWLLDWETAFAAGQGADLLEKRLRASPFVRLQVGCEMDGGDWSPREHSLHVDYPFDLTWSVEPWAAYLVARADGSATLGELLLRLKRDEILPADAAPLEFARAAGGLVSAGFLLVEGSMPPGPRKPATGHASDD